MKYIKEYKDIDWDDFDIEEDDPYYNKFKVGDYVTVRNKDSKLIFWDSQKDDWHSFTYDRVDYVSVEVINAKYSQNISSDIIRNRFKKKIPYGEQLIQLKGKWPWFRSEDFILK